MPKILVIDDDVLIRMLLKEALQTQGYEVLLATDGREGLAQAKQQIPALIICDWQMPEMDGLEVCRFIRADPTLSKTFFILLTVRSTVEDRIAGLDAGADEFLSKPIQASELKARVRSGLRLHGLAQDLQAQKQALEIELNEAADYVRSLLPKPFLGKVSIDFQFVPSRQLGGDCFDYDWLDPDYLMFYLLDVSGHGLGSALPSVSMQNVLRSRSLERVNFYQPSHVLKALNEIFQMGEHNDRYFTIWYGVYNQQKRLLTYASAGHPPAILLSKTSDQTTQIKRLKTRGAPIGMLPNSQYTNSFCGIDELSTLYIFSDGIYEIKQTDGTFWNLDGFVDLLSKNEADPKFSSPHGIVQQVSAMSGGTPFEDDCSLLQIKLS